MNRKVLGILLMCEFAAAGSCAIDDREFQETSSLLGDAGVPAGPGSPASSAARLEVRTFYVHRRAQRSGSRGNQLYPDVATLSGGEVAETLILDDLEVRVAARGQADGRRRQRTVPRVPEAHPRARREAGGHPTQVHHRRRAQGRHRPPGAGAPSERHLARTGSAAHDADVSQMPPSCAVDEFGSKLTIMYKSQ
jgi:hypothetical protein